MLMKRIILHVISCSEDQPCSNYNLKCLEGRNCLIECHTPANCTGEYYYYDCSPCNQAVFLCPVDGDCIIHCQGVYACYGSTFYGIISNVECIGYGACLRAHFYGINADIMCYGLLSCSNAGFYYSEDATQSIVTCDGYRVCESSDFDGINADITCVGTASCYQARFNYSKNAIGNTIVCDTDSCEYGNFVIYSGPNWRMFMITNVNGTERMILVTYRNSGNTYIMVDSKYDSVFEPLHEMHVLSLDICNECLFNVKGSIDANISINVNNITKSQQKDPLLT
eukprot:2391_1